MAPLLVTRAHGVVADPDKHQNAEDENNPCEHPALDHALLSPVGWSKVLRRRSSGAPVAASRVLRSATTAALGAFVAVQRPGLSD
jgi:hypothetical protein